MCSSVCSPRPAAHRPGRGIGTRGRRRCRRTRCARCRCGSPPTMRRRPGISARAGEGTDSHSVWIMSRPIPGEDPAPATLSTPEVWGTIRGRRPHGGGRDSAGGPRGGAGGRRRWPLVAKHQHPSRNREGLATSGVEPRNVVVILTDDQRFDGMSFMAHPFLTTPALDALAADGAWCAEAFVTTSLCCPSRASMLTGLYAHAHGVLNNQSELDPRIPHLRPVPGPGGLRHGVHRQVAHGRGRSRAAAGVAPVDRLSGAGGATPTRAPTPSIRGIAASPTTARCASSRATSRICSPTKPWPTSRGRSDSPRPFCLVGGPQGLPRPLRPGPAPRLGLRRRRGPRGPARHRRGLRRAARVAAAHATAHHLRGGGALRDVRGLRDLVSGLPPHPAGGRRGGWPASWPPCGAPGWPSAPW